MTAPLPSTLPAGQTQSWFDSNAPVTGGYPTTVAHCLKEAGRFVTARSQYDNYGNVSVSIDPLGLQTSYVYDGTYHLFPVSTTVGVGTPLARVVSQVVSGNFDTACLVGLKVQDLNNQVTTTTLDALCRPKNVAYPLSGAYQAYSYCGATDLGGAANPCGDPNQQHTYVESPSADGVTAQWSRGYFDGVGRPWRSESKGPSSNSIFADTTYDARGNVAEKGVPYYTGSSAGVVTMQYDALGRVTKMAHPLATGDSTNSVTTVAYYADNVLTTDEEGTAGTPGHKSQQFTDAYGHVITHQEHDGTAWRITSNVYDLLGRLLTVTDPGGTVESYTYDSLGRKIQELSPDHGKSSYIYDDASHLIQATDAKQQVSYHTYDVLGRLTSATSLYGTTDAVVRASIYDEMRAGYFNLGRATTSCTGGTYNPATGVWSCDPTTTSDQQRTNYDVMGRTTFEVRVIDHVAYPFRMSYDLGGRLLSTKYPDGDTIPSTGNSSYDGAGRLLSIPGVVSSVTYTPAGLPWIITNANGTTTKRTYGGRLWLDRIQTTTPTATIQDMTFTRYKDSLIKVVSGTSGATGETWTNITYDGRHQMLAATNATSSYTRSYSYLPNGNIDSATIAGALKSYSYDGTHPHAVHQVGASTSPVYVYDSVGNMTSRAGQTIEWDGDNLPVSVNGTSTFDYGCDASRISKTESGVQTIYPRADVEVRGCVTKYVSLGSILVAKRVGANNYWIHTDHLGSVVAVTDLTASTSSSNYERRAYEPYGEDTQTIGTKTESHDFTGQRKDDTGLVYLNARYYDPTLGRFLSADPTISDGINRYMYAQNDPMGKVDPTGYGASDELKEAQAAIRANNPAPLSLIVNARDTRDSFALDKLNGYLEKAGSGVRLTRNGPVLPALDHWAQGMENTAERGLPKAVVRNVGYHALKAGTQVYAAATGTESVLRVPERIQRLFDAPGYELAGPNVSRADWLQLKAALQGNWEVASPLERAVVQNAGAVGVGLVGAAGGGMLGSSIDRGLGGDGKIGGTVGSWAGGGAAAWGVSSAIGGSLTLGEALFGPATVVGIGVPYVLTQMPGGSNAFTKNLGHAYGDTGLMSH